MFGHGVSSAVVIENAPYGLHLAGPYNVVEHANFASVAGSRLILNAHLSDSLVNYVKNPINIT